MPPRFHATPPEAVREIVREAVFIDDFTFHIERPADADALFDHPWVRSAYAADQYTPYWATLWPSAGCWRRRWSANRGISTRDRSACWRSGAGWGWRASRAWRAGWR